MAEAATPAIIITQRTHIQILFARYLVKRPGCSHYFALCKWQEVAILGHCNLAALHLVDLRYHYSMCLQVFYRRDRLEIEHLS